MATIYDKIETIYHAIAGTPKQGEAKKDEKKDVVAQLVFIES